VGFVGSFEGEPEGIRGARLVGPPTLSGTSMALLFWWQSLTPTLIPRSWEVQAMIDAVCLAIGYGIGALVGHGVHGVPERWSRSRIDVIRQCGWIALGAAWLIGVLLGAVLWTSWQNEQRDFMGMASIGSLHALLMGALSLPFGALLVVIGRVMTSGVGASYRFMQRHVPGVVAVPATALLIVLLGIVLARGVAFRALTALADSIYAPVNEDTTPGTLTPDSSSVSGSSESLVAWDTLGRMGRDFVATATTAHELKMFHGADAVLAEPVRVYVGVCSAASAAERAELAVRELERAGGFDRRLLVVWIPTGSGWMIPEAAVALEQLHRGDTAIVAMQYSFLPSLLAIFLDAGLATEAGTMLFDAVHARWSELPPGQRPKLVLFGKSLGTAGVEAPFVGSDASSSVASMVARTDGALIAGAKHSNPIHSQLTRERDPRSPVWQPVFDGGRSVRFLNRDPDQPGLGAVWPDPRIVYLQHPSDPVSFWGVEALWWPPEWMSRPRGFDVTDRVRWFPIVSGVQAVGDMLDQLAPPPGFGHVYSTDYVEGWVSVAPPDGWTDADTARLEQLVTTVAGGESEP
jgi:uncharacterized membrane protein